MNVDGRGGNQRPAMDNGQAAMVGGLTPLLIEARSVGSGTQCDQSLLALTPDTCRSPTNPMDSGTRCHAGDACGDGAGQTKRAFH